MEKIPFRWGIMAPGNIAHRFMASLNTLPDMRLTACASRTPGKAETFAKQYGAPRWYDSYEALADDPDIDAIYISATNQAHLDCALLALNRGIPVLCEKPLAINQKQCQQIIDAARKNKVFVMEALWSRFFPIMDTLKQKLPQIGAIKAITGDFTYGMPGYSTSETKYRGYDPALAGGALLDVGIYVLSFACMVLGKTPVRVSGLAELSPLGVDAHSAAVFGFNGGELVSVYAGMDAEGPSEAVIYGSNGWIRVNRFWQADTMTLCADGREETFTVPYDPPGFQYEILETRRCVSEGLIESPVMPHEETLAIIQAFDELRAVWGLHYPCE